MANTHCIEALSLPIAYLLTGKNDQSKWSCSYEIKCCYQNHVGKKLFKNECVYACVF